MLDVLGALMANGSVNPPFPVFFGVWFVISFGSAAFFRLNKNASLKRKVWAPFLVVTSLVFIGVVWTITKRVEVLYFLVPAVCLLTLVNLRMVRFCDSCGDTVRSQSPWRKPAFCPKCGAHLQK